MANRRLVNLAMTDVKNRMFSLHRMDLSKLLFYPSTAEAEAAAVGKLVKPPKMGRLRLPPPIMGFEPFPTGDPLPTMNSIWLGPDRSLFLLLHGPGGGRSSEASRILFASVAGQAAMYDVDSRSVITVPDLSVPTRSRDDMPKAIVTGAGAGEERVYVMHADGQFELLDLSCGDIFSTTNSRLRWQALPPLPVVHDPDVGSSAVVDDGRIICVSFNSREDGGTFCFDTASREWWRVGDWLLPFVGRAEYVPELNTWLGFSANTYPHYHLCAADLSGVATAPPQAPTLQHVWEDFETPATEEASTAMYGVVLTRKVHWEVSQRFLVNLGSGRFCVAKVALGEEYVLADWTLESHEGPTEMFTVLTGVEVIRAAGGGGGELRMVTHKARELVHPGLELACVL